MEGKKLLSRQSVLFVLLGAIGALLGMLFAGAGLAYADKASFCGSCHSMQQVYSTWQVSGHKQFTCGDCHLPQENIVAKLYVKTENGLRHTYHETVRDYPENIPITPNAKAITDRNCLRCHATSVENTSLSVGGQSCIRCHRGIVHGQNVVKGGVPLE